jgi:hypothetical protein
MTEPVRPLEALKHISEIATEGYSATEMDGFDQIRAIADVALLQAAAPPAPTAEPQFCKTCGGSGMIAYWDGGAYAGEMCPDAFHDQPVSAPPERVSEGKRNRFDCPTCGEGIAVDEDGCCRTCGADAVAITAARPAVEPREEPR